MASDDLWGELPPTSNLRTPAVILREQAELLSQKTEGLLTARITTPKGRDFVYKFVMIAPTLANYSYSVLQVQHEIGFYPLSMTDLQEGMEHLCKDEEEFKVALGRILKSDRTHSVVSQLLTHIKSVG